MTKTVSILSCTTALVCALSAVPAMAAGESTTIGGRMYADFTSVDLTNDGVNSAANGYGIDVKRFYLSATHDFGDIWSINVTSDFNYISNDSQTQIYVKKAYIQAKLSDAFVFRAGSADLPWVPFVEGIYGLRFVENVIIDRLKYGTSADWGLHAGGKVGDGMFNYAVALVNGAGYKNPTRSDSMDVEGRFSFEPLKGLTLAVGGYSGKLGKDVQGSTTPPQHTANRLDLLAAYVGGPLHLGAEYFQAKNWSVTTVASDKADGYSAWATFDFTPMFGAFARADQAKTSKSLNPDRKDQYFNVGLLNHPRKNVDLALVYKHDKVTGGGVVSTSNGNIGGVNEGKYDEVGVWAAVQF